MDSLIEEDEELYYERYINEGSRSFNPYIGLDEKYHHNKFFMVPCYKVPIEDISAFIDNPSDEIKRDYLFKDENIIKRFSCFERMNDLEVRGKNYYIKLIYPAKISNYERKIGAMNDKHVGIISKQLRDVNIEEFR